MRYNIKLIEPVLRDIFTNVIVSMDITGVKSDKKEIFVSALLGRRPAIYAKLERRLVTLIGSRAPDFVRPFFNYCQEVSHPFDMECFRDGQHYTVKVVSSVKAFNSTTRKYVEEKSGEFHNPIILTLTGYWDKYHYQKVGKAVWYDAIATWKFLTGHQYGYKHFMDLVFDIAREYRAKIWNLLKEVGI